jgi:tetratricopeptide (TPR) repeat protein
MSNERYDLALDAVQSAIELAPERAHLYIDQGALLALTGDLPGAYEAYLFAVELAPYRTDYLRYLADFSQKYDFQVEQIALPVARRAVNTAPNDPANLDQMAQVMIYLGDLASAERFARRALEIDPEFDTAYLRLGQVYLLREQPDAALEALSMAMSMKPDSAVAAQARRMMQTYFP